MFRFCGWCGTLLPIEYGPNGLRFSCPCCPFVSDINKPIRHRVYTTPKKIDDLVLGDAAWINVDSTDIRCPQCDHGRAYFMQIQIRSADEPMTSVYRCCKCHHVWRD